MDRLAMHELEAWAASSRRKPLIVGGARQVGKTWLVLEFGRKRFDAVAHITFLDNETMKGVFAGSLDPDRLLSAISTFTNTDAADGRTLVFLDEIQECPRALTSLKMFCDQRPDIPVIAAGSLLGVALNRDAGDEGSGVSWPVGKVDYLDLHPMNFIEFLMALGEERYAELLKPESLELADAFGERYEDLLRLYFYIGGMPESVEAYRDTHLLQESRKVQLRLLRDYDHDFSKHVTSPIETERIRETWRSVPVQISRESGIGKFVYARIRQGGRGRDYKDAIAWLEDAGLVTRVSRISKPGLPLKTYEDSLSFKLFMLDIGLLGAALGLDSRTVLEGDALYAQGKGAMAEQYVCQQLVFANKGTPYYWSSDRAQSKAEVDFLYEADGTLIPLEVKSDRNVHSRSLAQFAQQFGIKRCQRLSPASYEDQGWLVNLPLFMADMLPRVL